MSFEIDMNSDTNRNQQQKYYFLLLIFNQIIYFSSSQKYINKNNKLIKFKSNVYLYLMCLKTRKNNHVVRTRETSECLILHDLYVT